MASLISYSQVEAGSGFTVGGLSAYTNVHFGYNNRTEGFSDELRYGVELGIATLDSKLWLIGRLNRVDSLKNGTLGNNSTGTSIFSNNAEFTSLGAELSYKINQSFGISAGIADAIDGRIILAAPSFTVGVFMEI